MEEGKSKEFDERLDREFDERRKNDEAIDKHDAIEEFLCQAESEHCTIEDTLQRLSVLSGVEIPEDEFPEMPAGARY